MVSASRWNRITLGVKFLLYGWEALGTGSGVFLHATTILQYRETSACSIYFELLWIGGLPSYRNLC